MAQAVLVVVFLGVLGTAWCHGEQATEAGHAAAETVAATGGLLSGGAIFYAIAITMSVACLSAGYAVAKVGAAALGAASEKPELLGRALLFVGLAEGIAIYGLIVSVMLILKL
jgi:V/A-type H+-transporting ATPase subunit K